MYIWSVKVVAWRVDEDLRLGRVSGEGRLVREERARLEVMWLKGGGGHALVVGEL